MNNTERLFWLSGIILLSFFCMQKISYIEDLEILDKKSELSYRLQMDQMHDLTRELDRIETRGYDRGFKEGESHALISSINGTSLYDYADGYHAAISQLSLDNESKISQETYSLFVDLLKMLDDSDNSYQELIDSIDDKK
jgi:hypothetical protein|tara:strand:+ start:38363 stop:38782 length:420 start_codon:yes stop_codon:yes gene_type:complete